MILILYPHPLSLSFILILILYPYPKTSNELELFYRMQAAEEAQIASRQGQPAGRRSADDAEAEAIAGHRGIDDADAQAAEAPTAAAVRCVAASRRRGRGVAAETAAVSFSLFLPGAAL